MCVAPHWADPRAQPLTHNWPIQLHPNWPEVTISRYNYMAHLLAKVCCPLLAGLHVTVRSSMHWGYTHNLYPTGKAGLFMKQHQTGKTDRAMKWRAPQPVCCPLQPATLVGILLLFQIMAEAAHFFLLLCWRKKKNCHGSRLCFSTNPVLTQY